MAKAVYKANCKRDNLVQRVLKNHFAQTYKLAIETKASQANVYYDLLSWSMLFKANHQVNLDLAKAWCRHVVPNSKSYITTEFTGKLLSDGDKTLCHLWLQEHPLFNIYQWWSQNINFENVDINRSGQNQIATVGFNLKIRSDWRC